MEKARGVPEQARVFLNASFSAPLRYLQSRNNIQKPLGTVPALSFTVPPAGIVTCKLIVCCVQGIIRPLLSLLLSSLLSG